jgi:enamine deaminase RidA (YjgF/YER057c/UK114 family)
MTAYNPPGLAPPFSNYSHAVEAEGRWLHVSGQVGVDSEGRPLDGFEAQAEQAWRNVLAVLEEAGMGVEHVVKVTMLLTRRSDVPASRTTRDAALGGRKPACTLFVVAGLADESWLVEIDVVAAAPAAA